MRLCTTLLLLASSLALAAPARAQREPLDLLLDADDDRHAVRARLIAHADSVAAADPVAAALAFGYAGAGYLRDGEPDSAATCYGRALALEPRLDRRMDLATTLLVRLASGDAAAARELLRPIQSVTPQLPDVGQAPQQGLFAWSYYLAGSPDSASILFAPVEQWLSTQPEWRYRMACVAFDREEWIRVMELLTPLAVTSRMADRDVMDLLGRAADKLKSARRLRPMLLHAIADRDRIEQNLIAELGGRSVRFDASDGFPLSGTLLTPPRATRPRSAVVLVAPGDTLALYDTLAVGLVRMGFAVLLADVRGSGRSVAPGCPSPNSWRGRESVMQATAAGDVRAAVAALAREARADSTRYLLVGVGVTAPIVVEAAALDRRARVLMLVSPVAAPVDRGPLRATLARLRRPVYFQTGPEDFTTWGLINVLYQACDLRASRVADSDKPGTFATLFRRDPKIFQRFRQWLAETWSPPTAPRPTRPSPPRKG